MSVQGIAPLTVWYWRNKIKEESIVMIDAIQSEAAKSSTLQPQSVQVSIEATIDGPVDHQFKILRVLDGLGNRVDYLGGQEMKMLPKEKSISLSQPGDLL